MAPQFMLDSSTFPVATLGAVPNTMTTGMPTASAATTLTDVSTTSLAIQAVLMTIAVLPLVFLISLILGVYISLRRHTQRGTYGLAPAITITRAKSKKRKQNTTIETSSTFNNENSQYGTLGRLSAHHASDWSISSDDNRRTN